jgi:putative mRNA 3-end processing factor
VRVGRKGKLRATPVPLDQPVVWRDGVHVAGTPIWCDARRARELCFVSRADRVAGSRHGQLIATSESFALMGKKGRGAGSDSELAVPLGRPFSLGTLRLELFRSGSALGAAALAVDTGERRVVYAGALHPRGGGLGGAGEQRACDVLVVSAHHGLPHFRFPPLDDALGQIAAACRGHAAVLLVPGWLEGLDVASALERAGVGEVVAHRSIHHAAQRLRAAGQGAIAVRRAGAKLRDGQVLIWPLARRGALASALPAKSRVLLVAGDAVDPAAVARAKADSGIAWSTEADHGALVRYIDETRARAVYLLGRHADAMARELDRPGRAARPLAAPQQMSLFP